MSIVTNKRDVSFLQPRFALVIMQVPSNLILGQIERPAWYLCGCMAAWGAISASTAAVQNFHGLLACRFLLGFLESAFFPGAVVSDVEAFFMLGW